MEKKERERESGEREKGCFEKKLLCCFDGCYSLGMVETLQIGNGNDKEGTGVSEATHGPL